MDLTFVGGVAVSVVCASGGYIWWTMRRTFASTERVERLENRLTEMEAKYANMPGADDVHEMRLRMTELSGDIRVLSQRVQSFSHQLELLLENAVNRGKS